MLLLAQLLFWRGTHTFNVLNACWVDYNSQVETMFMFLMNPPKWWHVRIMWTNSPFNAHNSEWGWAISIPDQTEKETNQKLHGSVTSIQLQIWSLLFKESENLTPTVIRLYYFAIFLLKFPMIVTDSSFLETIVYPLQSICCILSFSPAYFRNIFLFPPAFPQPQPPVPYPCTSQQQMSKYKFFIFLIIGISVR